MKPKEKAEELVSEFKKYAYYPKTNDDELFVNEITKNAKLCAFIAVDEIVKESTWWHETSSYENPQEFEGGKNKITYWQEVKQEIEKL